jgi:hypothetical protein
MSIIFETTEKYGKPKKHLYIVLADHFLLGKKFSSLEEALGQMPFNNKSLAEYGFYVEQLGEPKDLPVSEAYIFVNAHTGEEKHRTFVTCLPVLKARFIED